MTIDESKALAKGDHVYWQGNPADRGIIAETRWDAGTIAWDDGKTAIVQRGDMREISRSISTVIPIKR